MSKIVRRLAAVAVIAVVLGVPGFSFAASPVERVEDDHPAGLAGFGGVLFDLWSWVTSVFGADETTGGTGGESGEATGETGEASGGNSGSNPENNSTGGGNGDAGPGADPGG